jgi:hypothetical protein
MSGKAGESSGGRPEGSHVSEGEIKGERGAEEKMKEKAESRADEKAETRCRTWGVIPLLGHDFYDGIRALSTKPIDSENVVDTSLVGQMILASDPRRILKEAERKFEMWRIKRGKYLPQHSQERMRESLLVREFINVVLRYVNGAFGYAGPNALMGHQFMLSLYSKVKDRPVVEWPRVAEEAISVWKAKPGFDEGYLRACAHVLLKTLLYLVEESRRA